MKYQLFIFILFISLKLSAQDSLKQTFINQKYRGGTEAFISEISSQLVYPKAAKENSYYTIAILHLSISKEGILENIEVLNRLKFGLKADIEKTFMANKKNWLPTDLDFNTFISITYSLYDNYAKVINVNYPKIISENILVTAYKVGGDSLVRRSIDYRKEFQRYENAFNKNIQKEYYKKSKSYLNKLLIIDPFYQDYYNSRLNIEAYTKSYDYACEDLKILDVLWNVRVKKMKLKCEY